MERTGEALSLIKGQGGKRTNGVMIPSLSPSSVPPRHACSVSSRWEPNSVT